MKIKLSKDSLRVLIETLQEDNRAFKDEVLPWYSDELTRQHDRIRVLKEDLEKAQRELEYLKAANDLLKQDNSVLQASLDVQVDAYHNLVNQYEGYDPDE